MKNLNEALDKIEANDSSAFATFEENLKGQENNITEIGEGDAGNGVPDHVDTQVGKQGMQLLALGHEFAFILFAGRGFG